MANFFYDSSGRRAEKVEALFTTIARRYDLINDVQSLGLHRRWKRRLVRLANPHPGERALDLCCGTGDIALALAARGADVAGLDFNRLMLEVAEGKAKKAVVPGKIQFLHGDALKIPFPDNSFDMVTIGYGLRNLANLPAGLREMQRVARPGGRLLALDFGKPRNAVWRGIYFSYLRVFVPVLGRIFCGNAAAYAYILESLRHYPGQAGVATVMGELHLANIRVEDILGGVMGINYAEKT